MKQMDVRTFLLARYRETMPAVLEHMWLALDNLPDATPQNKAAAMREYCPRVLREEDAKSGDIERSIIALPIALEVMEEWLAWKVRAAQKPP